MAAVQHIPEPLWGEVRLVSARTKPRRLCVRTIFHSTFLCSTPFPDPSWNTSSAPDPLAPYPLINYAYQLVGGVQLRQIRVVRDSCLHQRFVGSYAVPPSTFVASALNSDGSVGVMGASPVVNPAMPLHDGGASVAGPGIEYGFGCQTYFALKGVCPVDLSVSGVAATVRPSGVFQGGRGRCRRWGPVT